MIETPTVFVLGAGSSIPYGFPSGRKLKEQVVDANARIHRERDLIRDSCFDTETHNWFCDALKTAKVLSVDAFLEHRPEFVEIGKAVIAYHLCSCENESSLFAPNIGDDWHELLFQRMTSSFEHFGKNRVSFITFNYDRSLEHVLFTALMNLYGKSCEEVANQMRDIPIVHVHGQLGHLDWQNGASEENVRHYTPYNAWKYSSIAAKGIRIISEDISDTPQFRKAHELLSEAKFIYFLGFGYATANMDRLRNRSHSGKQ